MKKQSGSRLKRLFFYIFNVRAWIDWERIKSFTLYIVNGFKKIFIPQPAEAGESFEATKARLGITDEELLTRQKGLYRLTILMLVIAALIFGYAVYHLFYGTFRATTVSLVVMLIALVLAFRYHFWYFQIKEHKLGCSVQEWFRKGLMGNKHE